MENLLLGASAVAMLVGLGGLVCSHRWWPRAPARKPGKRSHVATACLLGPLGLAAATSFAQVGRSDRGCDANSLPGPEEVLIYRHLNYRGDYRILSVGNYPNSTSFSLPNDSVSSLKVGENVRIDLFWEAWFYMHYLDWITTLEGPNKGDADYNPHDPIHWRGLPYLSRRRAPARVAATTWNDQTASIRVQRKDHLWMYPGPGQVVLFTKPTSMFPVTLYCVNLGCHATTLSRTRVSIRRRRRSACRMTRSPRSGPGPARTWRSAVMPISANRASPSTPRGGP